MDLKDEIEKMLNKIEPLVDKIEFNNEKGKEMLENMKAYIADSKYFLKNEDLVKGFESIIWTWAILEICKELRVFKLKQ